MVSFRGIRRGCFVLLGLGLLTFQNAAQASVCPPQQEEPLTPDIVAEFASDAVVADGKISYQVRMTNCGADMDEVQKMFSKSLLVPKSNYQAHLVGQGLVVGTTETDLNLAQNQSTVVRFEQDLPTMKAGQYFFAVTINTKAAPIISDGDQDDEGHLLSLSSVLNAQLSVLLGGYRGPQLSHLYKRQWSYKGPKRNREVFAEGEYIPETTEAQKNNITHRMLDLGSLPAYAGAVRSGKYDLYHEVVNASFSFSNGAAMHQSRNILRIMEGEDQLPSSDLWDNEISARFMFFDIERGTAHVGAYTSMQVDKVWGAIAWQQEFDLQRRDIHVDYYSNAPQVSHLTPGNYVLGVMMNVTDRFTLDSYPENNLDLTYIKVPSVANLTLPREVWINAGLDSPGVYVSVFGTVDANSWAYEIEDHPDWLKVFAEKSDYGYYLRFTVDEAPIGTYRLPMKVSVEASGRLESATSTLLVMVPPRAIARVIGLEGTLGPDSPNVRLEDRNGVRFMTVRFALRNVGSEQLLYNIEAYGGIEFRMPAVRSVGPTQQHEIEVTVPLVGIAVPRGEGRSAGIGGTIRTNFGSQYLSVMFDAVSMLNHPL